MRCIIGLGNPGKKYELTRHNIGFLAVDSFALNNKLSFSPSKFQYNYSEGKILSSEFYLVKPTTYMNSTGIAILDFLSKHQLDIEDLLVIVDDIYLPTGKIRIRKTGGDGGHNGLKSIIYHLQSESFPRIRIGIGRDLNDEQLSNFVLDRFTKDEEIVLAPCFELVIHLISSFIVGGYSEMLNKYSQIQRKTDLNNNPEETQ